MFEPAEPVQPLPILLLNSFCAPVANPNAELEIHGWAVSANSSEQGSSPFETNDRDEGVGQGRSVAGAPVPGRKKTPKPFFKGELIDLTNEDDDEDHKVALPAATEPLAQDAKVFQRTYTLEDEAIGLIQHLPPPKDKEAMIRHDIMSEVNPNQVAEIIEQKSWDRLTAPPYQDPCIPAASPFTPEDRPKYPLSTMHPRGSLTGINPPTTYDYLNRYYDAIAERDPYAEKSIAQMFAAANENVILPGHLGKRRREEPDVDEREASAQRIQVYRDTEIEAPPPSKKPLLGSHRNTDTVNRKGKAKMAIGNLVHGYTSQPAGLFVKPSSKILRTPVRASTSASSQIEDHRIGGFQTSQQRPPNHPPNSLESPKIDAPMLMKTPSPRIAQYSQQLPPNPPSNSPEVYNIAAPILPETPSPQKVKQSQQPRITGRIHKTSQSLQKSRYPDAIKSKKTESEASKRLSASIEQQLQDSAAESWFQPSPLEPSMSMKDNDANKAKKVRTKNTKSSGITEPVRRSDRIWKKIPADVKI